MSNTWTFAAKDEADARWMAAAAVWSETVRHENARATRSADGVWATVLTDTIYSRAEIADGFKEIKRLSARPAGPLSRRMVEYIEAEAKSVIVDAAPISDPPVSEPPTTVAEAKAMLKANGQRLPKPGRMTIAWEQPTTQALPSGIIVPARRRVWLMNTSGRFSLRDVTI